MDLETLLKNYWEAFQNKNHTLRVKWYIKIWEIYPKRNDLSYKLHLLACQPLPLCLKRAKEIISEK